MTIYDTSIVCVLDAKDIHGPDFPGKTFCVLNEKEHFFLDKK